jgi:hypothetical protein
MIRPENMVKIQVEPAATPQERLFAIRRSLDELVQNFWDAGIVVTVELMPQQPLAMGNYKPVVSLRPVRKQ